MTTETPVLALAQPPPLLRRADGVLGGVAALMLVAMALLTCIDVVGRYFLNRPLTGAFELTELAMGALIFTSLPLVTMRRQQVTVDLFNRLVPRPWRRAQSALFDGVATVCMAVIGWRLWVKAADMAQTGETTAVLQIPVFPLVYYMAALTVATAVLMLIMVWLDAIAPSKP